MIPSKEAFAQAWQHSEQIYDDRLAFHLDPRQGTIALTFEETWAEVLSAHWEQSTEALVWLQDLMRKFGIATQGNN
jgi:hypothetical protein